MLRTRLGLTLFLIIGCLPAVAYAGHPKIKDRPAAERVPRQWIVVLRDDVQNVDAVAEELAARGRGQAGHRFTRALKGFVLHRGDDLSPEEIASDPRVQFIEPDGFATAYGKNRTPPPPQTVPTGINRADAELNPQTGSGIGVAIIDTGIDLTHSDLTVAGHVTFVAGTSSGKDDNGHGTHVAGTAGALDNTIGVVGIAPGIDLYAVKVLNRQGSGFISDIVRGIDWVTANAAAITVANMSLGGWLANAEDNNCGHTIGDSLHVAICNSVNAGVVYVVAAGNSAADVRNFRPAAYREVITVSALADSDGQPNGAGPGTSYGPDDTFASFSNVGSTVDLIAPGVDIYSTYKGNSYATLSGTSMASPHTAGAVALWIAHNGRPATGNATNPAIQTLITDISEFVGSFNSDPDGSAERQLNANTAAVGGTGSSVCCPAP